MDVVIGIDHGTTRTKAIALDSGLHVVARGTASLKATFPRPGWVEQDPYEILHVTAAALEQCLIELPREAEVRAIGLANQGETVILWDRVTGQPVYPAIVWQDRRATELCEQLMHNGVDLVVRERAGLTLDPYFSAPKARWVLDHVPDARRLLRSGRLLFGTTDTWLIWNWSGGHVHITDATTASRTALLNIDTLLWDDVLVANFGLEGIVLPAIKRSDELIGAVVPLAGTIVELGGLAVDQQAAFLSHACFELGMAKATYGTGTFVLMQIGNVPRRSRHGLLTTVAWHLKSGPSYALDGGIYTTGAAIEWLVDGVRLLQDPAESAALAQSVHDSGGVVFVPALAGLAAPHWDARARGLLIGLTRGTTRAHIARALLEGIALSVRDVIQAMQNDAGTPLRVLRVDGGPTANDFLMQFQADILGVPLEVADEPEATARGAALLAGLALGLWDLPTIASQWRYRRIFEPTMSEEERTRIIARWERAIERCRNWAIDEISSVQDLE